MFTETFTVAGAVPLAGDTCSQLFPSVVEAEAVKFAPVGLDVTLICLAPGAEPPACPANDSVVGLAVSVVVGPPPPPTIKVTGIVNSRAGEVDVTLIVAWYVPAESVYAYAIAKIVTGVDAALVGFRNSHVPPDAVVAEILNPLIGPPVDVTVTNVDGATWPGSALNVTAV